MIFLFFGTSLALLEASTFKKNGCKTGIFPVLQNLTHMCTERRASLYFQNSKLDENSKVKSYFLVPACTIVLSCTEAEHCTDVPFRVCIRGNHVNVSTEVDLKRVVSRTENHLLPISYDLVD